MAARTINLSSRHNILLDSLKSKLGVSLSETVSRALEALEEKEAQRDREVAK
jgi:hypothetical protein